MELFLFSSSAPNRLRTRLMFSSFCCSLTALRSRRSTERDLARSSLISLSFSTFSFFCSCVKWWKESILSFFLCVTSWLCSLIVFLVWYQVF